MFFFFKQKTAYEMRISDWSSDVCSSDLLKRSEQAGEPMEMIDGKAKVGVGNLYRLGWVVAVSAALLTVWTTIVRDDGSGEGNFMIEIGRASCRERVCQYV